MMGKVLSIFCATALACAPPAPERPPTPPYPPGPVISGISFDWSTHRRAAPGSDNWPLTWADDDNQYTSWGDGGGFGGTNSKGRVSLGFARIEGSAENYVGRNVWGDTINSENLATFGGKTVAIVSIGGVLYFWRSPGSNVSGLKYQRLYRSTDHAASWVEAGVEWSFQEHGIGLFAMLQFGRDYQGARDEYVYIYATEIKDRIWDVQVPGEIILMRVEVTWIEDQSKYEFFAGLDESGTPIWDAHANRKPVFVDANGVLRNSAIYNPGLDRYLLVTNHTAKDRGNLGIFDAPEPWGPWTTVLYESRWPAGGEVPRNAFFANFSPNWWSEDGRSFVFVFTGKEENDSWNSVRGAFALARASR